MKEEEEGAANFSTAANERGISSAQFEGGRSGLFDCPLISTVMIYGNWTGSFSLPLYMCVCVCRFHMLDSHSHNYSRNIADTIGANEMGGGLLLVATKSTV